MSTFKDYGALAAAYDARAKDKAVADDKIRRLALDLTANLHAPRDQAKALYDWVAANIQYAGNCVGEGSVVPHQASLVLSNRMGDCKDHATLLQAMLAVKGIASSQVLVNAGSAYTLPPVASVDVFDHAINYIPAFDLYADSTSRFTPFGSLPMGDSDKPVVHTSKFTEIRHTPPTSYRDTAARQATTLTIHPDGSADGVTTYEAKGFFADGLRATMQYIELGMDERMIKAALESNGYIGTGSIAAAAPTGRNSTSFSESSKFHFADAINVPGPGALPIRSPTSSGSLARYLSALGRPDRTVNYRCYGSSWSERYTIRLPANAPLLAAPRDVELKTADLTYKATYRLDGNTLEAEREIDDQTHGNVCTSAQAAQRNAIIPAILRDFRAQLVYR